MEYGRYVGRVGALAVALGIGVAVANGGVAHATTDPEAPGTSQDGDQGTPNPTDNTPPGTPNPDLSGTPTVGADEVGKDDAAGATAQRRVRPRVMILDALRGANVLGARRADASDPDPAAQRRRSAPQRQGPDDPIDGTAAAPKFTAPTGSDPVKSAVPSARALQRTLGAITTPTQRVKQATKVLPGPTKAAAVVDTLTDQTQRQAATITGPSALDAPPAVPALAPKPGNFVINLLSSIGLRPDAFPPGSPFAPIGQVLEFAYAGLRRIDHTLFNETPTATPLVINTDEETGVVRGRVATDYESEPLQYRMVDGPDHGEVVLNPDGTFVYTPNRDETRDAEVTDQFTVVVSDRTNFHLHLFSHGGHTTTVTVSGITVAPNNTVIDTIGDGAGENVVERPEDLAVSSDGSRVYIVDRDAGKVHVIDTRTNTLIDTDPSTPSVVDSIQVSDRPEGLAVVTVSGKEYLYVANWGDDTVSVVDTTTFAVTTFALDPPNTVLGLSQVAATPNGTRVYVTGNDGVYAIDTSTNTVIASEFIALDNEPDDVGRYDIAITPDGQYAYVVEFPDMNDDSFVYAVKLSDGQVTAIPLGADDDVEDVVISPDGRYVYASGERLIVIDTSSNTVVATIDSITDPRGLAISPDGKRLYVTRINFDNVTVVDTDTLTIVDTIPTESPWNIAVTPDNKQAYVIRVYGPTIEPPQISVIALQAPAEPAIEV